MSFTFTDDSGNKLTEVYSCTECIYVSTKEHFRDGDKCTLCNSPIEKSRTIKTSTGMSSFEYRMLLDHLLDEADGVGQGTVDNIEEHFDSGDAFLTATETAYRDRDFEELTAVSGVGTSSARAIALAIADYKNWDDGAILKL